MPGPSSPVPSAFIPVDAGQSSNVGLVSPEGNLATALPAVQLFNDTFGAAAFDTNLWTVANGGTGVAPTAPGANASTTLSGGTTANSYSALTTKPVFVPTEPGFLVAVHRVNLQNPPPVNNYLAWGLMNLPSPPTFATPITDGAVFDVVAGVLFAATYAGGTRLAIANLGPYQPKETNAHKYYIRFRGDVCYWSIDTEFNVVAAYLTGASGPNNNSLSSGLLVVSNAGAAATLTDNGSTVSDTSHTTFIAADGKYGFRKQSVNSGSANVAPACNYTPISTAGTTTVAAGGGVYFGMNVTNTGTSWTAQPFDINGTVTSPLAAIGTAGGFGAFELPGISGLGVRFGGNLVIITTGTPGAFNALWD